MNINEVSYSAYNRRINPNNKLYSEQNVNVVGSDYSRANNFSSNPIENTSDSFELTAVQSSPNSTVQELKAELEKTREEQGFIGGLWDGFKNLTGLGAGSNKAEKAIEQLEKGEITEEEALKALEGYQKGQTMCVDVAADIVSGILAVGAFALAVPTGGASLIVGLGVATAVGAGTKIAIKGGDALMTGKEYGAKELLYDSVTGAVNGLLAPVTNGIGASLTKTVGTKLGLTIVKEGAETVVEQGVKQTFAQGVKSLVSTQCVDVAGGNIAKRALALGVGMAADGAIGGAADNMVRAGLNGDNVLEAGIQGAAGGMIMAPIIGGGFRMASKAGSALNNSITTRKILPDGLNTKFKQGQVGDCALLSTLDGMMNNPSTSSLIKKSITKDLGGNYNVKIGERIVKVSKSAITDEMLSDTTGIKLFEQAYKQIAGNLDGGFAEVVAKEFGLHPIHIAQESFTDELLDNLAKQKNNLVLSLGANIDADGAISSTGNARHYFTIKEISPETQSLKLTSSVDTSKTIELTYEEVKRLGLGIDGGSINETNLPNATRSANDIQFRGEAARVDAIRRYGISEKELDFTKELVDVSDIDLANFHFLRENSFFDSSEMTLIDAIEIREALLSEIVLKDSRLNTDFLTEYEKIILKDKPDVAEIIGSKRRSNAATIKASTDNLIMLESQDPKNLLYIGEVNEKGKSVFCMDARLRDGIDSSGTNAAIKRIPSSDFQFVADLAKSNMITDECLDAYRRMLQTPSAKGAVDALAEIELSYSKIYGRTLPKTSAKELLDKAITKGGIDQLDILEQHKLNELFADLMENTYSNRLGTNFSDKFSRYLHINEAKYNNINKLVQSMKKTTNDVFAGSRIQAESDHFFMRLIDRDLIGTTGVDLEFYDYKAMLKLVREQLEKNPPSHSGDVRIEGLINLSVKVNVKNGEIKLVTLYNQI